MALLLRYKATWVMAFCNFASKKLGHGIRFQLPEEAEAGNGVELIPSKK